MSEEEERQRQQQQQQLLQQVFAANNIRAFPDALNKVQALIGPLTGNPLLGAALQPLMGLANRFMWQQLDELTGAPLSKIPHQRMNDIAILYQMRMEAMGNQSAVSKSLRDQLYQGVAHGLIRQFYSNDEEGEAAFQRDVGKGGNKLLEFLISNSGIFQGGINSIVSSVARRANILAPGSDNANADITRDIVSEVAETTTNKIYDAYIKGDTGSLSFSEIGYLSSKMIQRGGLDSVAKDVESLRAISIFRRDKRKQELEEANADIAATNALFAKQQKNESDKAYLKRVADANERLKNYFNEPIDVDNPEERARLVAKFTSEYKTSRLKEAEDRVSESTAILSQQIFGDRDPSAAIKRASDAFSERLKGYAKAADDLKAVFEGDLPQVLSKLEALSGTSFNTMSLTHVRGLARDLQHMALTTGISGEALATLTKTFYTQGVGAAGGNEAFARNAAMNYAYRIVNGPRVYGVSQQAFERSFASLAGVEAASGANRTIAAAYQAYLYGTGQTDSDEAQKSFQALVAERGGDYGYEAMRGLHDEYMARAAQSTTFEETRRSWGLNELKDSTFIAKLAHDAVGGKILKEERAAVEKDIRQILIANGMSEKEASGVNLDVLNNETAETLGKAAYQRAFDTARAAGASEDKARQRATEASAAVRSGINARLEAAGAMLGARFRTDTAGGIAMLNGSAEAEALRNTPVYEDLKQRINLPGKGLEPLLVLATRAVNEGKRLNLGQAVGALTMSIDTRAMNASEYVRFIENAQEAGKQAATAVEDAKKTAKNGTKASEQEAQDQAESDANSFITSKGKREQEGFNPEGAPSSDGGQVTPRPSTPTDNSAQVVSDSIKGCFYALQQILALLMSKR